MAEAGGDVILDASGVGFVEPFGLTLFGAALYRVGQRGHRVLISGLNGNLAGYLQRMDLLDEVECVGCSPPQARRLNRADALVELTRLDCAAEVSNAAHRLACALVGQLPGVDPDEAPDEMTGYTSFDRLTEPLQYTLSELLENALTHARREGFLDAKVWVAGQYYPKNDLIQLGVVDTGCGLLATLRRHPELRRERHLDAILTALKPRVSCNRDLGIHSDSVNQGVGLTTTQRIAEHAGGRLVIVTGDAIHDTAGRSSTLAGDAYWQGVAVAMECRRAELHNVNFRELLPPLDGVPPARLRFE
jgi:hypothetical protein